MRPLSPEVKNLKNIKNLIHIHIPSTVPLATKTVVTNDRHTSVIILKPQNKIQRKPPQNSIINNKLNIPQHNLIILLRPLQHHALPHRHPHQTLTTTKIIQKPTLIYPHHDKKLKTIIPPKNKPKKRRNKKPQLHQKTRR